MIQKCCPDMVSAINELMIKDKDEQAYIEGFMAHWDINYCPFCGREIVLIQDSQETRKVKE